MVYLGIEIGGTKLQIGLGPGDGRLLQLRRENVDVPRGPDGIREQIAAAVPRLLAVAGIPRDRLKGVGIGFGGPVDDATRTIIKSHQIEGWDGFPLADWVSEIVKCPAALGNDADVAGLAEALFGAGKGLSPVFYFNIGSGIGGGLIIDGQIYRGCGRGAAEFGHLKVLSGDSLVNLEDIASGWSMGRRVRALLASGQGKDSLLTRLVGEGGEVTAAHVGRAAAANDPFARLILEEACDAIGQALRHVVVLLCPRRIVLGGGVSLMGEVLFEPLRRHLDRLDFVPFVGRTDLVRAALGEEVVVHGALALARRAFPREDPFAVKISQMSVLVMGSAWRNLTFLKLTTDEGLTGISEVRLANRTHALLGYLEEVRRRYVLGADPFRIEQIVQRMFHGDYGRVGEINAAAISLVEIACWDIVGKAANLPVYQLLGGAVRERIGAYANAWYQVPRTTEDFARAAQQAVAKGYRALKFDPFQGGPHDQDRHAIQQSIALVEAVRDAVGPHVELMIEMHGRFRPVTAVQVARDLEPFEPSWVEEPVGADNLKAFAKAARRIRLPVATGERFHHKQEFRELFELQACDVVQLDITACCGLLEVKKVAAMADVYGIAVAPHNVGGPVSTAAALHFAASTPHFLIQEHFNDFTEPHTRECAAGCPQVADGFFGLPGGPGLGVILNEEVIRAHPPTDAHFNLYGEDWQQRQPGKG